MNFRTIGIVIIWLFVSLGVKSQAINPDTLKATIYNKAKDYNFSNIHNVYRSSDGYIWLGLWKQGLLRINGDRYRYYLKDEEGRRSFNVSSIYEDSKSQMWVGDEYGFQKFDRDTGIFSDCAYSSFYDKSNYETQVVAMQEVNDSLMLLGGLAGIHLYNINQDTIEQYLITGEYSIDGASTNRNIKKFYRDDQLDIVWFTSRSGLGIVDLKDFSVSFIDSPYDEHLGHVDLMTDIVQMDGRLYIRYKKNKILSFDPEIKKWKVAYFEKLPMYHDGASVTDSFAIYLNNFQKISDQYFLTSGREFGAMIFDTKNDSMIYTYISNPEFQEINKFENPSSIQHKYFSDAYWAFVDGNGHIQGSYGREMVMRSNEPLFLSESYIDYGSIKIEKIFINGKSVLEPSLWSTMEFKEDERNIGFEFCLVNPSNEINLTYRYKLDSENEWQSPLDGIARFNELVGGSHKVVMEAVQDDEVLDRKIVNFHISKRWYEVWYWLCSAIVALLLPVFFLARFVLKKNNENLKLKNRISESEMSALRAQMNPHFLFNSLNSINQYIMTESPQKASRYLTKFSMLMRSILNNSKKQFVPLNIELNSLNLYVEMEQLRFNDLFDYQLEIADDVEVSNLYIPPLILQPYVENAIIHGISSMKDRQGLIVISIENSVAGLKITITDNGVGRAASKQINEGKRIKKDAHGMDITSNRIHLITQIYKKKGSFEIEDVIGQNGQVIGTKVSIVIPQILNISKYE